MLRKDHIFKKSLCLILTLSLILLPAGCGEKSENTDSSISIDISNEADSSLVSNAADTALPQGTETPGEAEMIEDKFVMLQEVYDILSGPLGEPYRTPEYWGGEEIDMMKVGDGYLIGLRNSDYQMHYLLYERETDSIIEIDTQEKRIIWEDIDYRAKEEQLVFPYFEQRNNEQEILGTIIYHLPDKSYEQEKISILDSDTLWKYSDEIPVPQHSSETLEADFSCLLSIHNILSQTQLPSMSQNEMTRMRELFREESIVILNQLDYLLIGLQQDLWSINYYLYEKEKGDLIPMEIYPIMLNFEKIRFQQQEGVITFPYSGQKILDICDFPTTVAYDREEKKYTEYFQPLLGDHPLSFQLGASTPNPWEIYRTTINQNSPYQDVLCIYYEMGEMSYSCDPPYCPRIFFESNPDRTVSILIENAQISQEAKQKLLDFDSSRIQNLNVKEVEKEVTYSNGVSDTVQGLEVSFIVPEGYYLFGEVTTNQNQYDTASYLNLCFSDDEILSQNYFLEYEYLG